MLLKSGKKFLSVLVASVAVLGISANLVPKVSAGGGRLFQVMGEVGEDKDAEELLAMLSETIRNYDKARDYYLHEVLPWNEFNEDYKPEILNPMEIDPEIVARWENYQFFYINGKFPSDCLEKIFGYNRDYMETRRTHRFEAPLLEDFIDCDPHSCLPGGPAYEYVKINRDLLNDEFLRNAINSLRAAVSATNERINLLATAYPEYGMLVENFEEATRNGSLAQNPLQWTNWIKQTRMALIPTQNTESDSSPSDFGFYQLNQ